MIIYCFNHIHKEGEKLKIRFGSSSRRKQIFSCICCETPVTMLAASVNSCEWFFMKKYAKFVSSCHALHHIHQQLIMIDSYIHLFKVWCAFKLCRRNFIMSCLYWNS